MKVALFVHCFFPEHFYGTETYTLELARNLKALGHEVTVVTAVFQGEPPRGALVTRYEFQGIPVVCIDRNELPHRRIRETYHLPGMAAVLTQVVRELRPDIAHVTHLINHTAVLLEVLAAEGVPRVGSFTDFFGFCYNNKLEAADGSLCVGPNLLRSNCIECHLKALDEQGAGELAESMRLPGPLRGLSGAWLKLRRAATGRTEGAEAEAVLDISLRPELLRERYALYARGIAATRFLAGAYARNRMPVPIERIPFGVDIDRSPRPPRPADAPIVFGFVGQIAPHKGTDLLVEAFARLPAGRAALRIHGPANQDPRFFAALESAAAGHAVEFAGTFPPERMNEVMRAMDVLVIPSRWYENSPLVLLYALATHTPVIVTDVEGLTEFVEEGASGFAFPKGDVAALARAMARFTDDPALVGRMSGRTEYAQDTRRMTEAVVDIYRSVVAA